MFSTVATSQLAWTTRSQAIEEPAKVPSKKTFEVAIDGQTLDDAEISFEFDVTSIEPKSALFRVSVVCGGAVPVATTYEGTTPITRTAYCYTPRDRARLIVENIGADDATFTWRVTGVGTGFGSNDPPDDAFVNIQRVPSP